MILYELQLVLGNPCKSLVLASPWKLPVPVVLGQPWKWLTCLYHIHPKKWVKGVVLGVGLATVRLDWVGMVLRCDGLLEMPQLLYVLQLLHLQLQWLQVGNCRGWRVHL